ncbi:sulfotransferase domain-containing protein [Aurantiacibacter sp. MUD61]|uniref:sulfotransferase domain-containing protein n=1 Tax=Aurantiacibacter sp. MUD61 TaxID=3009083 RepID=UPI0022F03F49|nr:sulfotransferase domain-containing protein [Aurantiacibacter sp. MUD61]
MMRRGIYWIASYPKSGNTWVRILLSNLVGDVENTDPFQLALVSGISSDRQQFDEIVGLSSSDLTPEEVDIYRPHLYARVAADSETPVFIKVHDGYHRNRDDAPIFPPECSLGVIYVVRDPMDVAVSFSHHQAHTDYGPAVRQVNAEVVASNSRHTRQLRQQLLGWSDHYRSWHDQDGIPVMTVRYEDLLADTAGCLRRLAAFAQIPEGEDEARIRHAVEASSFRKLQETEAEKGFREKPEKAQRFFRSGRSGEGREKLTPEQQQVIIARNGPLMRELGYL